MKKRIIALALALLMLCAIPVSTLAAEAAGSITVSYNSGTVSFSVSYRMV